MAKSLQEKLRIARNMGIVALNAPHGYGSTLGELPEGTSIRTNLNKSETFVHLFVRNRAELEKQLPKCLRALAPEGLLWISYPKVSSGIATDLTRDKGWESLEGSNLRWLALISFDAEWSAFLLRNAPPQEQSRASKDYHAAQNEWADPRTKTVHVPKDLAAAFKKSKEAHRLYEALAYTNKKEYVLWVVGAKREETRKARITGTIEKLLAGRKTPSGR